MHANSRRRRGTDMLVGETPPVFAYPSGACDDAAVAILQEEGVELAFTQVDGHNDLGRTPPLRLYRTNITRKTTPAVFPLRLQRWMTWVDRWRHRERPDPDWAARCAHPSSAGS